MASRKSCLLIVFSAFNLTFYKHGREELCPGFTPENRALAKACLTASNDPEKCAYFTPHELPIIAQFGSNVSSLLKRTLKIWAKALLASLALTRPFVCIRAQTQVETIMRYLRLFQTSWEKIFGVMPGEPGDVLGARDGKVYIESTGYGAKVLLGLMMADRLSVVDTLRIRARENVGHFREVCPGDVDEEHRVCTICYECIGHMEDGCGDRTGIQMITCCGQVIGGECLRFWAKTMVKANRADRRKKPPSCPHCREEFDDGFLAKLFNGYWDGYDLKQRVEKAVDGHQAINLVGPAPTPESEVELVIDDILQSEVGFGLEGSMESDLLELDDGIFGGDQLDNGIELPGELEEDIMNLSGQSGAQRAYIARQSEHLQSTPEMAGEERYDFQSQIGNGPQLLQLQPATPEMRGEASFDVAVRFEAHSERVPRLMQQPLPSIEAVEEDCLIQLD